MARHHRFRRALRRAVVLSTVTGIAASTALVAAPVERAFATTSGNLLVSTGVYADQPAITAGQTVLPITNTSFTISTVAQTASGQPVSVTTSKANNYLVG